MFHLKSLLHPRIQVLASSLQIDVGSDCWTKAACIAIEKSDELFESSSSKYKVCELSKASANELKGKRGEALSFVGRFDFSSIPEIGGCVRLYLSPQYRDYQPKERGWNLLTLEADVASQDLDSNWTNFEAKLAVDPDSHPALSNFIEKDGTALFFGAKPGEALNIAAFHANGISYSPARAKDPHYGHLLDSARNWFVLLAFREKDIIDQETSRILYICMTEDDFNSKAFGKCQLVFV